ncbi:MAG: competence protein ComEC [Tardiphaga sp.]|nr:competence protein ComEC [Tardiphaga sp.]
MGELGGKRRPPRATATTWPPRNLAQASGASNGNDLWQVWLARVQAWRRAEAGAGRLMPWIPIAFGTGIALYFAAEREPVTWVALVTAVALSALAFMSRRSRVFVAMVSLASIASGFAAATIKASRVAHDVLTRPIYTSSIKGFVETREERERTDRFVLRVTQMDTARGQAVLARVRLSVKKATAPKVGQFVELKARLLPPLSALRPGAYDFSRDMYFQGIAASGFAMGAITVRDPPAGLSGGWSLRYAATMQGLRDAIDARIRAVLSGDSRAIATALLTGKRDAISAQVNDAMFVSGLGHVLSISGYHMAVVAGIVFFAARALLALIPALTVTFPIKKVAAAAALVAATFYLLLSGAEVATQRSFVMAAVVLVAIMVDRRAITFRTLAIAAMIVLLLTPEALVHPSFQMSFAATLGLVALVQIGMPKVFATPESSRTARAALWGGREIAMLALASLVAGLATTPYAAFHFHRFTPYGVLANLAAMPVVSILVMPAGILGLVAMPFGFDGIFWRVMDFGIVWMIAVAQWVAALPGAIGRIAAFGIGPLITASGGIILLGLLRTPLRFAGAGLLAVAMLAALRTPQPDVLISGDGRSVGVRGQDGVLNVMSAGKDAFVLREWLGADADARVAGDASLGHGVSCDVDGCVTALADGALVALALTSEALPDDCQRAAIVVSARPVPADCAALAIGPQALRARGAMMIRRQGDAYVIAAQRPRGTDRPWSPAVAEADDVAAPTPRAAPARPADATPAETDLQADD